MSLRQRPKRIGTIPDLTRKAIWMRSASRNGYSDLGKNRRRLEDIRSQFTASGENDEYDD